jgi:hypothetical protein
MYGTTDYNMFIITNKTAYLLTNVESFNLFFSLIGDATVPLVLIGYTPQTAEVPDSVDERRG